MSFTGELLTGVTLWRVVGVALLVLFGLGMAPGLALRLIVRLYPKGHARRAELVAELYAVNNYRERPLFVAEKLELAICEGIPARWRGRRSVDATPPATTILPPPGFRDSDACFIVGMTRRQLDYWIRTGLLVPFFSNEDGTQRRYTYRDLLELKVIKRLLDAGISLQSARTAISYLRTNLGETPTAINLVLSGNRSALARSADEILDMVRARSAVLNIVSLAGVKQEVDAAILELGKGH